VWGKGKCISRAKKGSSGEEKVTATYERPGRKGRISKLVGVRKTIKPIIKSSFGKKPKPTSRKETNKPPSVQTSLAPVS